jgi:hypothetical protein
VSTLLGGAVVLRWLARRLLAARSPAVLRRSAWRLRVLGGVALASIALGAWNGWRWGAATDYWSAQVALGRVAVGAMVGMLAAVLAFSVWARRGGVGPRA